MSLLALSRLHDDLPNDVCTVYGLSGANSNVRQSGIRSCTRAASHRIKIPQRDADLCGSRLVTIRLLLLLFRTVERAPSHQYKCCVKPFKQTANVHHKTFNSPDIDGDAFVFLSMVIKVRRHYFLDETDSHVHPTGLSHMFRKQFR